MRSSACGVSGQRSLHRFAHRICQAIVHSVGPGDKPFTLRVLQVVFYFVFDPLPDGSRALNLALPQRLAVLLSGMCLYAGKQFADVRFVMTKQGERGPELVVHAFHNLSEVLRYFLEKSEDVRIAVLLRGLVERYVVSEGLVHGDRIPYHQGEYSVSGPSYKHQCGYLPLCGPDYLRRNVKMMSDARYVERLVLRHNEGPPGKRIARPREPFYDHLLVWGYCAREILTCAQQPIQSEEDGGVATRVNLEPLFEP